MPQVPQQPGPGTPQQAQQLQPQIQQQPQEKFDNISKVKSLITPLRESLAVSWVKSFDFAKLQIFNNFNCTK
jgi:mediator of RNA polymerase II transcription subunit 29